MTDTTDLKARLREEIAGWEAAYPLSIFPEPDLKRAAAVLKEAGLTLDAIGASSMRHVVSRLAPSIHEAADALDAKDRTIERFEAEVERLRADLRSCEAALGRRTEERNSFAERLRKAADDLRTVGDDCLGSSCHKWCHERAAEALKGSQP